MKSGLRYISYILTVMLSMTACSDDLSPVSVEEVEQAEPIIFTTLVPDVNAKTRSAKDEWDSEVDSYKVVHYDYTFKIGMYKDGQEQVVAESMYIPKKDEDSSGELQYSKDGTLKIAENATPLYWENNSEKWGFKAESVTDDANFTDQEDETKWFAQDKLVGYGYLPIWNGESGSPSYQLGQFNYRTSKEWYADNKTAKELSGLMVESDEDYKKIPLYLQHQRAWVTIILKAGEGVTREALAYATSDDNITTTFYSYKEGKDTPDAITKAWSREEFVNYESDKNGDAAEHVSTTRYDAIVEPHNFIATKESQENDIIARINVSNQNFTFAASNDLNYNGFVNGVTEKVDAMQAYNLQPGKHLTITATLSRASRLILITALVEDWTETVTQTICDDYGQNGDPIQINDREELIAFLSDTEKNKAGNVGLIVPDALSLTGEDWSLYDLKGTLNLAGTQLIIDKPFLNSIERTGSIVNGEIRVADSFIGETAIAQTNAGTIERVQITTTSETSPAKAAVAGFVETNHGTIYLCSSALSVYGETENGYVGGIAAKNLYDGEQGTLPVIDACTVLASVNGDKTKIAAGGGIVGQAEGRVSNNTFEYGITLSQDAKFQNIIGALGSNSSGLTHQNNAWPTTASYKVKGTETTITNSNPGVHYTAVIDNRDELKLLLSSSYNQSGELYRIAKSFSVNKENWIWGSDILNDEYFSTDAGGDYAHGNVKFNLNGNNKTITLTGESYSAMLFGNILGEVYDLNIIVDKPIVASRISKTEDDDIDTNSDAIAAFAYAVTGTGSVIGQIRNITVKAEKDESGTISSYIESSTPGGIVVFATQGGIIKNCASNVPVKMNLSSTAGSDVRHYAGGIVACAENATITQCKYYGGKGSIGWIDDNTQCQQNNCRYGGIVGGTTEMKDSQKTPSLSLVDCSSWWELPTFSPEETTRPVMGSLIGSTVYHDLSNNVLNAMADGNEGNWWMGTTGADLKADGITEVKAIGKKNSVAPTVPKNWQ